MWALTSGKRNLGRRGTPGRFRYIPQENRETNNEVCPRVGIKQETLSPDYPMQRLACAKPSLGNDVIAPLAFNRGSRRCSETNTFFQHSSYMLVSEEFFFFILGISLLRILDMCETLHLINFGKAKVYHKI